MKLTKLHEQDDKLVLRVTDVTSAYINTLRRYMTTRVPTMAIDFVEFHQNSSILYDEMVAQRMGLIPLTTDLKGYRLPEEEWNEPTEDPRVEVALTLKVEPVEQETVVRAGQLVSKDKKVVPVFESTPIVKLVKGQSIELIATARLGTGTEHAKWAPGHVWYRHFPHITIKKQPQDPEGVAQQYPDLFEVKSGKLSVKAGNEYLMPDKDFGVDGVEVAYEDSDYVLYIESWGQLSPAQIVEEAVNAYDDDLDAFEKLSADL